MRTPTNGLMGLLALVAAGCAPEVTGEATVATTYFTGDRVRATTVQQDDGSLAGTLEDADLNPLSTIGWRADLGTWSWAGLDGEAKSWDAELVAPNLEAANVANYVLWLKERGARPGPGDPSATYSDRDACIDLAYSFGQCVGLEQCEAWCESLP